uniref:YcxB family protein n=1 Tax=Oceanobacillus saliphilus TaxID=2925834 RepID=UPI00201DCF41
VSTVIFALLLPIIINKAAVKLVRKSENSKRIGPISLHLSDEGIEIQRETDPKQISWKEINQVTSDNENYFLYYGDRSAVVIPKNAVPSQTQLIEFLSIYVGKEKIVRRNRVGLSEKQRRVVLSLLVIGFVLLSGVNYYSIKPDHDVSRAARAVGDLFVYTDLEGNGENRIKESTNQEQIDLAIKELKKIDTNKSRYKKYDLAMLNLYVMVNQAQKQLNQREGNQNPERTNNQKQEFTTNSDLSTMENLIENFPDLQSSFDEVPWDIQGKLLLPSLDDIPFYIEEVNIEYNDRPSADVYYAGDGKSFTSSVWYYEEGLSKRGEEVQLINGTVGYFRENEVTNSTNSIWITWIDQEKDSGLLYSARL